MTKGSALPPVGSAPAADQVDLEDLRKEGWTMALYVAICLIAALTALEDVHVVPGHILGLVWGTTVGLAIAHVFAFRVAGRLVHDGELPREDRIVSGIQLAGAAAVAVIVSIPVVLAPTEGELDWARYTCAGIIGVVGYATARSADHGRFRAILFGIAMLVIATGIAAIKHRLAGH